MSLALLTRGYICAGGGALPPDVKIGKGPAIVRATELKPTIDHGRQLAPKIVHGEEEDQCP